MMPSIETELIITVILESIFIDTIDKKGRAKILKSLEYFV